jgi:Cu+-exporting ATPase
MTKELPTTDLQVEGMNCASCANKVETALKSVTGVVEARVNLSNRSAHVEGVEGSEAFDALVQAIEKAGYKASPLITLDVADQQKLEQSKFRKLIRKATTAAALGFALMIAGWLNLLPAQEQARNFWIVVGIITLLVMVISGGHYYRGALRSIRYGNTNMDTLIALGTGTAWAYSMFIALFPDLIMASARHFYFEAAVLARHCRKLSYMCVHLSVDSVYDA